MTNITNISSVYSLMPLELSRKLELFITLIALVWMNVPRMLEFMNFQKMILVKLFATYFTFILLHFMNLLYMFLQTIFVGKDVTTFITRHLSSWSLHSLVIDLLMSLQMSIPREVFITNVALEGSLSTVS